MDFNAILIHILKIKNLPKSSTFNYRIEKKKVPQDFFQDEPLKKKKLVNLVINFLLIEGLDHDFINRKTRS